MNTSLNKNVLIVEPNQALTIPYSYFPNTYTLTCLSQIRRAQNFLKTATPDLVLLSTSFPPRQQLHFLESLQKSSQIKIIPLIFVVDLSQQISHVLGTTWGGDVRTVSSTTSKEEFLTTLNSFS